MLFLSIMLSMFVSSSDTVNVSKEHTLQEIVVVASRIRNKGNKIIVQMREDENKTMDEVLASVPHVAVTESGISIDGRGKVKVLFNGHEVRMEGAALISYLQSLRSSDVSKVEVQTVADASQDANVQGGVINIILRKQKDNGLNGSIENRLNLANAFFRNTAAVSVFSRWNKVNLYASFSNPITTKNDGEGRIKRVFNQPLYDYNSESRNSIPAKDYNWRVGGFADLSTRWNIGAEYAFTLNRLKRTTNDRTSMQTPEINMHDVLSFYTQKLRNHLHSLQADVSYKIDNEGSKIKFSTSCDVRRLRGDNVNLFENKCDSSNTASIYKVLTMDLSVFKRYSKTSSLLFGLKHNSISADNNTMYGGVSSNQNDNSNAAFEQKERIFAGYAQFTAAYKKLNYEVGLRYEYVATKEFPTNIKRNYSDLFPYVSMGYDIDEYGKWKVIASYSRKIARPL
ncbi:MAG: outer membrane beta-barrel protein, partial [Prevotella pallens]|uniref:outer membrane beta-barrel protein n=1 Tax=Prevotella pallens TaxID=60133 RepID=UPI001CAC3E9C